MKPFFGINITDKSYEDLIVNGYEFSVQSVPHDLFIELVSAEAELRQAVIKGNLPRALQYVFMACVLGTAAAVWLILNMILGDKMSFADAFGRAPWLFWGGAVCFALWMILLIAREIRVRRARAKENSDRAVEKINSTVANIMRVLEMPEDAETVDVLQVQYKKTDGGIEIVTSGDRAAYNNRVFTVCADGGNLYLADTRNKFAIALSSMKAIRVYQKKIEMERWSKRSEEPHHGRYHGYDIFVSKNGRVTCSPCYILEFTHDGEDWGILFPCYELPIFESLTGLKAIR